MIILICDKCYYIAFILLPQSGDTALHKASNNGHSEVVQILVQSHTDVDVKGEVSILTSTSHTLYCKSGNFWLLKYFRYHMRELKFHSRKLIPANISSYAVDHMVCQSQNGVLHLEQ
jgi:ankyrin repeat protein